MMPKKNPISRAVATTTALVAGFALSTASYAQKDDGWALEEVVVTAQKRQEKLSDVPVAVTVMNSDQIDAAFANNIEGLQQMAPSVSFRKGNTTRNSALTIRGIGTISFSIAAEPSVSTVVDGVVLGRSGQAFGDLYDLERVEVLRGPQGTLFGKNASAGVVNMTTKRPGDEFEGSVEAQIFQDNEYSLKAMVSGPLTDRTRGSLTVLDKQFDGYIKNEFNNQMTNGYDRQGLRGMLEFDAAEDLNMLFIVERYEAEDECCTDLELLPSGRNPDSPAAPDSNGIVNGKADLDLGLRKVDHDLTTVTLDETTAFSVQINKTMGEYEFTSITAYRAWDNTEIREGDFTSIAGDSTEPVFGVPFQLHDIGPQEWRQLSQEFRLASPVGEFIEYQLGAFYWNIESERSFTRDASCQNNNGQLNQAMTWYANETLSGSELENALADIEGFTESLGVTCNANDIVSATAHMRTEFNNWAFFGDGKVNVSDDMRVLFGLRYTDDEIEYSHKRRSNDEFGRRGVGVRPATENTDFSGKADETNVSGKLGFQWDLNEESMVYATASQGYKGPGFNIYYNFKANGDDAAPISEETSDALELGWKYTADTLILNAAIFRTEISDFQANNFDCSDGTCITRLTNAGDVTTEGIELDFTWRPMENLTFYGGIASIEAEIDKFNCPLEATSCSDRSGLPVPFAPELKYSLMAEYVIPMENMDIILNGSFVHTDEQVATLPGNDGSENPAAVLPEYDIFNASIGFSFDDDRYRISLIGKNLGDEEYVTTYSGDGFRYQVPRDAERYFGAAFRASF
ncbi:TonB-dependent receptor [Pseudomaricurvus alkylphenolicus]|uniref:TonB-dependent receptor n=1 Tax=Pseudomaricurvus alkylphenolicus TaxID=1306991 RepID=UPI00141D7C92|nr:TonB-dependent receptor [Pseudomaricurvus alkylphenolicus]NIB40462.1 TonB-dependent receptor [Pseudomaricurvus alkylphenolicus]